MIRIYLYENLAKLNNLYGNLGILFEYDKNVIRIRETKKFLLNNYPEIKEKLKEKYNLTFNDRYKWHIGKEGEKRLNNKKIKIKPSRHVNLLKRILFDNIDVIKESSLKDSLLQLLNRYLIFFKAPASKVKHHDYKHGLLDHTIQVLEIALNISKNIEETIDEDLLIAGAILHDIGKINCYEQFDGYVDITETFLNFEHIINGIKLVSQEIKSEKLDDLLHIISSHHQLKKWGSPVKPNSIEAWIIHFADDISAKIG